MITELNVLWSDCADFFKQIYIGETRVLVFGEGDEHASFMLIGEAPGETEALEGRPFVGKAGRKLDEFLSSISLPRESVYISNAVKFRPTKTSKAGRTINRAPTREEIALWRPWLSREISIIKPKLIITLGNTALRAVTDSERLIGETHGLLMKTDGRSAIFPLYHPASVIYKKALLESYNADLVKLSEVISNMSNIS